MRGQEREDSSVDGRKMRVLERKRAGRRKCSGRRNQHMQKPGGEKTTSFKELKVALEVQTDWGEKGCWGEKQGCSTLSAFPLGEN